MTIERQCELLGLSRSGYYYKLHPISETQLALLKIIDVVYTEYPFFGARQMSSYLKRKGWDVGRKRVSAAYKVLGLESTSPKPKLSIPNKEHLIYPYLLRGIAITHCNQVWSTDITFIRLNHGFVYLMAIIDWFSRYILDWEVSITLEADFCIETLKRVLNEKLCEIFNTDQGSQFTSYEFTNLLLQKNIRISMDGKGRSLDNVFVERFWRSLKYECIYLRSLNTVREATDAIKKYFEFYNNERPHQALNNKTPAEIYFGLI